MGRVHSVPMAGRSKGRSPGAPVLQRSVADLRALAHPLRLRMMELFAESPKTTKQVADLLGQPPTRLYHHVAALERAGLLVLVETRQNRGAVEKWYTGVARQLRAGDAKDASRPASRAVRRALAATVLEQAKHEIMSVPKGAREAALLARVVIAAPPANIPALRRRLYDVVKSMREECSADDAKAGADHERWAATIAFAPVVAPRSKRRARR